MEEQKKELKLAQDSEGLGIKVLRVLHPSFYHYVTVLLIPLALLGLIPLGVDFIFVLLTVWVFEILMVSGCWVALVTTRYVIQADRIEITSGILVRQSRSVPYDKIVNITGDQSLLQRLFNIGNIFIDTAGGKPFETALFGVENHQEVVDFLFALKQQGGIK